MQEDINTLLQSSKSQTDIINELKEKLNESESNLKKEFNLVENWTLEKEVKKSHLHLFLRFFFKKNKVLTNQFIHLGFDSREKRFTKRIA